MKAAQSAEPATPWRVLVIDDEPGLRHALSAYLEKHGFLVQSAPDAEVARELLRQHRFDLALADVNLPRVSGIALLPEMKASDPNLEVIMITCEVDISLALEAMRGGAYDFLTKPFSFDKVHLTIHRLMEKRRLEERSKSLENLQRQKESDRQAAIEAVKVLARAAEERDRDNIGHGKRCAEFSALLGRRLGFHAARLERLRMAARLHDIGKIGIDDRILNKPDRLDPHEFDAVKRHPEIGSYILTPMTFLRDLTPVVRHHHENWDGSGYPDGLAGEDIPIDARIVSLADFFDSITSLRPYRRPMATEDALQLIVSQVGTKFDPLLAQLFVEEMRLALPGRRVTAQPPERLQEFVEGPAVGS